ncbi:MAG: HAD-IC family P-type ATPase [Synechococcaceae cyanobacterium]|nr:HAD-IC family P-type ATPase [Synechococcaceae cyanobacterium]
MALLEPTNLLLLACALLYGLLGEPADAAILLLFVVAISLLDLQQQRRSRRALAALARLSAPRARVRRGDQELLLAPEALRIGDRLRLEEGDRVAADCRLVEAVGLWLDESLLSGESLPVSREPGAPLLAGSLVSSGRGWGVVTAVADATELGRIGRALLEVEPPPTRLQRRTRQLTSQLTLLALGLCAALAVLQGSLAGDWPRALLAALALALAVLPNEIPVVLALFLALGSLRLARIGVLARRPTAVESLGSATVLAVDKTGTLTENRMAVQRLLCWPEGLSWRAGEPLAEPWHGLLEMAVLASRGDPVDAMELAIQRLADEQLQGSEHLHPDWPLERDYPLSSDLLVFSQLWRDQAGAWRLAAKGAPEAIAQLCHLPPEAATALLRGADQLAADGLRVLAVARGLEGAPLHGRAEGLGSGPPPQLAHDFLFTPVGLVGLADPLRADVPAAVAAAGRAGVRVLMITGDGPRTARAIADQAGLRAGAVLCGVDLERLSDAELAEQLAVVPVYARVMPQQKLRLVRALQAAGEVVAMTGDGVNDGPALKAADIGVAMGLRGTAVAREAADLVLLRDTFADLVGALGLARRLDANLQRALGYTLAIHLPIAVISLLPLLLSGQALILLPVHIALLHLVIDPACTVVFEALPGGPELLQRPPRPVQAPLFEPGLWQRSLLQGLILAAAALLLAFWPGLAEPQRRSLVFALLLLAGGGLVWLQGDRRSPLALAGAAIGPLLGLLVSLPPLRPLLALAPLDPTSLGLLLLVTALALGLIALLPAGTPGGLSAGDRSGVSGRVP